MQLQIMYHTRPELAAHYLITCACCCGDMSVVRGEVYRWLLS